MENNDNSADVFIDVILDAVSEAQRADLLDIRIGPFWTVVHTSVGRLKTGKLFRQDDCRQDD